MSINRTISFLRSFLESCRTRNITTISKFWVAVLMLVAIVSITHLVPTVMGLSFWPLPYGSYTDTGPMGRLMMPANLTAVDNFSFPHVDWPWRKVARHFLELGEIPLWNPYASLGLPFVPQYENQLFFPLEWIEIFGDPYLWNVLLITKILLAGIGSMLLVRCFCLTTPAILAGGLFYAYSGYFLWLNTIPAFINGTTVLPWLLLSVVYLFDERMRIARRLGQFALALGLLWLTGQPQIAALSSLAAFVLFIWLLLDTKIKRQNPGRILLLGLCGVGLGLLIAAPQLWLFFEAIGQTYTIHTPNAFDGGGTALLNFTISIWPFLFGQLMNPWAGGLYPEKLNWEGFPLVVGTSGFLLTTFGLIAFMSPRLKEKRPFFLYAIILIFVVSLMIVLSGSLGFSVWTIQGLDRINFPRYIVPVLSLCTACLCAYSVENLSRLSLQWWMVPSVLLVLFAVITVSAILPFIREITSLVDPAYMYNSLILGSVPSVLMLITWTTIAFMSSKHKTEPERAAWAVVIIAIGELTFFIRLGFDISDELLRLVSLAIICLAAVAIVFHRTRVAGILMASGLISFISILVFANYRLAHVQDPFVTPPKHIAFLQLVAGTRDGNPRILSSQGVMTPNVSNAFGLSQLNSNNPLQINRTARIIFELLAERKLSYITPNGWWGMAPEGSEFPTWDDYFARRSVYNAFAVEYLVDSPTGPLSMIKDAAIKPVYSDSNVTVYRDLLAMPRAYVINAVKPVKDFDKALAIMQDSTFDPRVQAVVEAWRYEMPAEITKRSKGQINGLTINYFGSTRIEIALNSSSEGLAVLADAYYPGWKAEVDGQPRTIYIVNGVLRGVVVGPEDKVLIFYYSPRGLSFLFVLAMLAFLVSMIGIILPTKPRRIKEEYTYLHGI